MSSSTSSSRLFLGALAAGLALAATAFTLADESYLHTGPEFGMAQAMEDRIAETCATRQRPELVIIGDSRAVAGLSAQAVKAHGVDVEKFALGGSGVFAGWAVLDRLIDCGVRPREVVMAYGTIHLIESGAIMDRTTNFDGLKGPRAAYAYDRLARWEDRALRRAAYRAVSLVGAELSLVDLVLLRPSLRNVLERPAELAVNRRISQRERAAFSAALGDRYYGLYGLDPKAPALPEETNYSGVPAGVNLEAARAIAALGREHGFPVRLYILPVSEAAVAGVDPAAFEAAAAVRASLEAMGIAPMNDIWSLPIADFGDPSHVNESGRAKVTADFMMRLRGVSVPADAAFFAPASQLDDPVSATFE